mmetsp:Transcript_122457/g.391534  ORF Transcript_122457/g.391534 Transcript_122457/m.391534 type:complete len:240 (+) Transcript_122457:2314-3033(+)
MRSWAPSAAKFLGRLAARRRGQGHRLGRCAARRRGRGPGTPCSAAFAAAAGLGEVAAEVMLPAAVRHVLPRRVQPDALGARARRSIPAILCGNRPLQHLAAYDGGQPARGSTPAAELVGVSAHVVPAIVLGLGGEATPPLRGGRRGHRGPWSSPLARQKAAVELASVWLGRDDAISEGTAAVPTGVRRRGSRHGLASSTSAPPGLLRRRWSRHCPIDRQGAPRRRTKCTGPSVQPHVQV